MSLDGRSSSAALTPEQALNRGNNLLIIGFSAANATGLLFLLTQENELVDQFDDVIIILIAVAAAG